MIEKPKTPRELHEERDEVRKLLLEHKIDANEYSKRICRILSDIKCKKSNYTINE